MADWTRTNLSCTNPEIISSGSTFQKNTKSKLLGSNDNIFHYLTERDSMHEEIIELSKVHPNQTFTATTWDDTAYYFRVLYTTVYHRGMHHEINMKPGYVFSYPCMLDEELKRRLIAHIKLYLERIEKTTYNKYGEKDFDLISHKEDIDGFSSYLTITWENEDHRFIATNKCGYMFDIEYKSKDRENLQKLREKLQLQKHEADACRKKSENDNDNSEYIFPFK